MNEQRMADTGVTILITGSGFEGQRLKEDVGITTKEKLEMSCVSTLPAAMATHMQSKSCRVSHPV